MIDTVWDTYRLDSLKAITREKRGKDVRRKVSRDATLPIYFPGFLQDDTNKEKLFALLTEDVVKHNYPLNKQVFVSSGPRIKSNHADISMEESDHEKADSRICLPVHNTLKEGAITVLIRRGCNFGGNLSRSCAALSNMQLWVGFRTGKLQFIRPMNLGRTTHELCVLLCFLRF